MRDPITTLRDRTTPWSRRPGPRYLVHVLRGQAQVDFLPNAVTGAVFSVALFAAGWAYGLYGLLGTAVGTATAHLLGVDRERITAGLEGFNACLVAVGSAVFLGAGHLSTALLAVAGSVLVTIVTAAVARVLGSRQLPTLTLPFCLTASAMTLAAPGLARLWHHAAPPASLPQPAGPPSALSFTDLWHGLFANVAQIFFMPQWYVGALFLIGIFLADRTAGAMACLGSLTGTGTAWALGAPAAQIASGAAGYNAVLVAMALCGVFLPAGRRTVAYALTGAAAATTLTPALTALTAPSGGHAFTWPFVLVTLVFLAAAPAFPHLRATGKPTPVATPASPTTPTSA
ncbi:urea transporter [Streptomyces paromomycinus]|uniref:Urea transporter DVU1160 n=1 Tax=Streptomyces paromomycinus TaxID=92743 RepID=A0A401WC83_STREY|nr:urea transporter [Streptomyces paromomycinus]GCD46954.1 urea transporter DVU1160 [Streptomyces paromomycinus]